MRPEGAESPDRCQASTLASRTNAAIQTASRPHASHRSGASVPFGHMRPSANFFLWDWHVVAGLTTMIRSFVALDNRFAVCRLERRCKIFESNGKY